MRRFACLSLGFALACASGAPAPVSSGEGAGQDTAAGLRSAQQECAGIGNYRRSTRCEIRVRGRFLYRYEGEFQALMEKNIRQHPEYARGFREVSEAVKKVIERERLLMQARCELGNLRAFSAYFPGNRGSGETVYTALCETGYVETSVELLKRMIRSCSRPLRGSELPCMQ